MDGASATETVDSGSTLGLVVKSRLKKLLLTASQLDVLQ